MEFFSENKPDLIGPKMKRTVNNIMQKPATGYTVSDKVSQSITWLYTNYIKPNKITTIFILSMIIFLTYRYYNKKAREEKEKQKQKVEKFSGEDTRLFDEISEQTAHLRFDTQPTLNPIEPIYKQQEPVNYPPEPLPINIPGVGTTYKKNLYDYSRPYQPINTFNYDYDNVYKHPHRTYYTGTLNTYANAQDTDLINALGFPTDFNTTTGNFVGQMTDFNTQNVTDYQTIIDNMNANLVDSMKIGPKFLDSNTPDFQIEPPYADQI